MLLPKMFSPKRLLFVSYISNHRERTFNIFVIFSLISVFLNYTYNQFPVVLFCRFSVITMDVPSVTKYSRP